MRVLLSSSHRYPALRTESAGLSATPYPSGSAYMTHDLLAKGLAELGHEVLYFPRKGAATCLPEGVKLVHEPSHKTDILHSLIDNDEYLYWKDKPPSVPRLVSCHIDPRLIDRDWGEITAEWIFVSRSLAQSLGGTQFVWNGINPEEYIFSETKQDYHLFMAPIDWAVRKGLDTVIDLAQTVGFRLMIAGGSSNPETIRKMAELCADSPYIEYVGDVRGTYKAELLAGARSLIFPTKVNEAFGLVIAEALMSGTPVICSRNGACEELVSPDVGFVCDTKDDYISALNNIGTIRPENCRQKALRDFHYGRMAEAYVSQYEQKLRRPRA